MVAVIFPDGTLLSSRTWPELERELREDGWNADFEKDEFRTELALRAWNWSLTGVRRPKSSRHLFRQLERAGLLRIVEDKEVRNDEQEGKR